MPEPTTAHAIDTSAAPAYLAPGPIPAESDDLLIGAPFTSEVRDGVLEDLLAALFRYQRENGRLSAEARTLRDQVAILEVQLLVTTTPAPRRPSVAGRIRSQARRNRP